MTQTPLTSTILAALRQCLPANGPVALHEPCFARNEWAYVKDCLDTGWVSSVGAYVDRFEQMLADYTGVKRAVAWFWCAGCPTSGALPRSCFRGYLSADQRKDLKRAENK